MADASLLVVFHSRSGTTRRVAHAVAQSLGAEIEEIADLKRRTGLFGLFGAILDALGRRCTPIGEPDRNPADYDIVIIGSPVWNGRMSAPVRSYLDRFRGRFKAIAFLCTSGGKNDENALFAEMADFADCAPKAVVAVTEAEVSEGSEWENVTAFEESIVSALRAPEAARRSA